MKTIAALLLLSAALVGQPIRYVTGHYAATAKVTSGKYYHYVEGEVSLPSPTTRGLLLFGVGELAGPIHLNILSWHEFGGPLPIGIDCQVNATKGLVPRIGLVSMAWLADGPRSEMFYLLSIPKWTDGITMRWQTVIDDGKGGFWVSDAWKFTGS